MDLFTYLMSKKGNNIVVNDDLFAYLLGKAHGGGGEIKTATGITINIPDAIKLVSFMMTKESTQDGEPTPENPIPVEVVKGYRNLFDKDNANIINAFITNTGTINNNSTTRSLYINCEPNTTYTISKISSLRFVIGTTDVIPAAGVSVSDRTDFGTSTSGTITTNNNANYLIIYFYTTSDTVTIQQILDSMIIVEGTETKPYVSYGNNYVNVAISDGTNTNNYPIPLNNNELVGIGDYKDELKVDKNGHVFINKKIGKVVFDGSENWILRTNDGINYCYSNNDITDYLYISDIIGMSNYFKKVELATGYANALTKGVGFYFYYLSGSTVTASYLVTNLSTTSNDLKNWLSNNNVIVYYPLETPELIDLQTTVDLKLFKGVNNVSNSEDGYMTIEYK